MAPVSVQRAGCIRRAVVAVAAFALPILIAASAGLQSAPQLKAAPQVAPASAPATASAPVAQPPRKVVLIAGEKSHGPGEHEYELDARLLKRCLETSPDVQPPWRVEVHTNGWPADPRTLADADSIVILCDGADRDPNWDPLLQGDRFEVLGRQMRRGCGLVVLHYGLFVPTQPAGERFLEWLGGYFDYEHGADGWFSKTGLFATTARPAAPGHPVSRGVTQFELKEEFYYNMRFREPDPRRNDLLQVQPPDEKQPQTVAWAVQRSDGGRGFACTGGHFHKNWEIEPYRRLVLNAIVWTARAEVPAGGVRSTFTPDK